MMFHTQKCTSHHHKTQFLQSGFALLLMKDWIQKAMPRQIASGSAMSPDLDCLRKHLLYLQYRTFMLMISEAFQSNITDQLEYCDHCCVPTDFSAIGFLSLHILTHIVL